MIYHLLQDYQRNQNSVTVRSTGVVIEWTSPLVCIPVYIKGQKDLSLLWLSDLPVVGSPMIRRVNNDVTGGLTTGHWSTPL